jgi:hypothetical protein
LRRFAKIDDNQHDIVKALRKAGATVQSLAAIGDGCPDLLVGICGRTVLMEIKDGSKPPSKQALTPEQLKWHGAWQGGTLQVVNDVEGALRVVGMVKVSIESTKT